VKSRGSSSSSLGSESVSPPGSYAWVESSKYLLTLFLLPPHDNTLVGPYDSMLGRLLFEGTLTWNRSRSEIRARGGSDGIRLGPGEYSPLVLVELHPKGRYAYAAIVHHYLYWTQTRTRDEAGQILQFAMEDPTVDRTTLFAIYQAVRLEVSVGDVDDDFLDVLE